MSVIEPNWPALLIFLPAWFLVCSGLIYLSDSLPPSAAPVAVRSGLGPMLIWANLAVLIGLCSLTLVYAWGELRLTSLIIAAGFIFLFAPFAVQDLPPRLKETQLGQTLLLVLGVLALAAMCLAV